MSRNELRHHKLRQSCSKRTRFLNLCYVHSYHTWGWEVLTNNYALPWQPPWLRSEAFFFFLLVWTMLYIIQWYEMFSCGWRSSSLTVAASVTCSPCRDMVIWSKTRDAQWERYSRGESETNDTVNNKHKICANVFQLTRAHASRETNYAAAIKHDEGKKGH